MSYSLNIKKLIHDVRGPKGVAALSEEINKLSAEAARISDKLSHELKPQAVARLKRARAEMDQLQSRLHRTQKSLEKEVRKTLVLARKYSTQAEMQFMKAEKRIKTLVMKKAKIKKAKKKITRKTSAKRSTRKGM